MKTTEKYKKLIRSLDLEDKVYPERVIKVKTWVLFLALIFVDGVFGYYALVNLIDSYTLPAYIIVTIIIGVAFGLFFAIVNELDQRNPRDLFL